MKVKTAFLAFLLFQSNQISAQSTIKKILKNNNLVALWDFKEAAGQQRHSLKGNFSLNEMNGKINRINEGPLSGYSSIFGNEVYLALPNEKTGV